MEKNNIDLLSLGFNSGSKGLLYWKEVINICSKNKKILKITDMYEMIAEKYDCNVSNVERAMRVSLSSAKENIKKTYNFDKNITNKNFMRIIQYTI